MRRKTLIGITLALALAVSLTGTALAAPAAQEATPITGTVQSIAVETDATTGESTVVVEVLDELGATQTVRLSAEDAATLGLVTIDPETGEVTPVEEAIGTDVSIDPALVISDEDEAQHPVGAALAEFFGVDYDTIMEAHEEGAGFGVIAQALWMSQQLEGGSETFTMIVDAKQDHDYSGITMPDGSTPENWGQFKHALQQQGENLGAVMSGHADPLEDESGEDIGEGTDETTLTTQQENGNNGHGHGRGRGKGKHK